MEKKNIGKIVTIALICILVSAIVYFAVDAVKDIKKGKEQPQVTQAEPTPKPKEKKPEKEVVKVKISSNMIKERLGEMGTLVTADYGFTQVETYQKTKKLFSLIDVDSSFMYSYDGSVYAGVDFKKIKVEKDDEKKEIRVEMPPAAISSVEIDYKSFKVYSEKEGFLNPLQIEDYNLAQEDFDAKARAMAEEKGILKKAEENAKSIIETFVLSMTDEEEEEYKVIFK